MVQRRIVAIVVSMACCTFLWAGPSASNAQSAEPTRVTLRGAVSDACRGLENGFGCRLQRLTRDRLGQGVVEFTYRIRVGPNPHEVIRVHRVVHETKPGTPDPTRHAVFFVHGDAWGFDSAFAGKLGRPGRAPNVARWLARRGMDVWGIDLRWVLVPASTANLGFMRSWGSAIDIRDIQVATSVERALRARSGSGSGRTALLGWSRGGFLAYAYANYESRLPARKRNVNALIPVDTVLRYAASYDSSRRLVCSFYRSSRRQFANGEAAQDNRVVARLGRLGLANPSAPSPIVSGVTNRQAALTIGAEPNASFSPWYHFVAGFFNANGVVNRLKYTPPRRFMRFLAQAAPFEAEPEYVTSYRVWCGRPDRLVDNVSAVRLPVLYLAAAGGFGTVGSYSTSLLGSHDVRKVVVRMRQPGHEGNDFGHVDLWQASNSRPTWPPLLHWLRAH
jgi:pimeloyl-ACP methyl ester carboxylesterase